MFLLRAQSVVLGLVAVLLMVPPVASGAAAAEHRPTRTVARAVDGTGQHDVTSKLQAEIDRTPDGGTLRLRSRARYRIDGTLRVEDRHDLVLDGNGATVFAATKGAGDRSQLRIVGGSGLVVHDLTIVGANAHAGLGDAAYVVPMVGQHGIRLEGAKDVEIARVEVRMVYGDFVYVGPGPGMTWSDGVWIHDSTFERSGRQGISVTAGRHVVIEHNSIAYAHRAIIDLEPNGPTWGAEDVQILHNEIGPSRLLFVAAAGSGPVNHVVIAHNRLRGHILAVAVLAPVGTRRTGVYVLDNESDSDARRPQLSFSRVDGVVVRGNVQSMTRPGEPLVHATGVCGLLVRDNETAPGTLEVGTEPACGPMPALAPPAPPPAAGRPDSRAGPAPTPAAAPTTTTTRADTGGTGGPTWPRVAAALVLALAVAAVVVRWAWRGDRRANERTRPGS